MCLWRSELAGFYIIDPCGVGEVQFAHCDHSNFALFFVALDETYQNQWSNPMTGSLCSGAQGGG